MKNTLIQINKQGMGSGDQELSLLLIQKYLELLQEEKTPPSFIVFYNEGVKLLCKESKVLESLKRLDSFGTKLIACSTCLNHFNLQKELAVGISGSMMDIIDLQKKADRIITL